MKILMRNIGMTLHVIHKLRAEGVDNVQVNMDWQHLIMNGENLAEYAALLADEGLLGHQHANSGWGTFDDDNMVGLMRNIGMTLHVIHKLRAEGVDNVQVNMDWQHLIMNGENLAEYAALLADEGLLGHQHANSGWGTFDDDNMVGATAFMETLELALELRRAKSGSNGERLGLDLFPYTEDQVAAVRRSVEQWRFIDSVAERIDDASTPRPGWSEQDPEDWWRAAAEVLDECEADRALGIGLSGQMHGRSPARRRAGERRRSSTDEDESRHLGAGADDHAVRPRRLHEAVRRTLEAVDFAGELGVPFIIWPGIEGYNYPFQTPYAESWARFIDAVGQIATRLNDHGRLLFLEHKNSEPAMKIFMRNIGMTLHVIHTLRRQGIENIQVNMDWQHLIMNGEHLPEYAALLAAEGLLGHQHANSGWGTFDDDNMVGATAFMETVELALELRRAGYGDNGERLGFDLYPYTEDQVAAVRRSVEQWHFIDEVAQRIDGDALRAAQAKKDAVAAYELVYAALGARPA